MIDRFLFLRKAVSNALADLSIDSNLTEGNFVLLEQVQFALEPLKLDVEALCRQNSILISASAIFCLTFAYLVTSQSKFSIQLTKAVKKRVIEGRQGVLVSLLRFLHNPKCLKEQDDLFPMPSK